MKNKKMQLDDNAIKQHIEITGHRVTITKTEVHRYKGGQKHLHTWSRETYVSSIWYKVEVMSLSTFKSIYFKTKINLTKPRILSLEKAWKKALDFIQG